LIFAALDFLRHLLLRMEFWRTTLCSWALFLTMSVMTILIYHVLSVASKLHLKCLVNVLWVSIDLAFLQQTYQTYTWVIVGCKLWLRTTLSPSVMRNTLLGHCFHTRDEKSHKEIFDLFLPFLQACRCSFTDFTS
jgi:hypothetical protein